jgi:hypothetical protein
MKKETQVSYADLGDPQWFSSWRGNHGDTSNRDADANVWQPA